MTDNNGFMNVEQVTPADIGFALKTAREAMQISLTDISHHTRISKNYLKYIEAGQFDMLPGNSYVMGFLRNYCDVVNIDAEPLIAALKQADKTVERKTEYRFPVQALVPKMATSMVALILVTIALGGYVFWAVAINDNTAIVTTAQLEQLDNGQNIQNQFSDIATIPEQSLTEGSDLAETTQNAAPDADQILQRPARPEQAPVQAVQTASTVSAQSAGDEAPAAIKRQPDAIADAAQPALAEPVIQSVIQPEPAGPQAVASVSPVTSDITLPAVPELRTGQQEELPVAASTSGAVAEPRIPQRELVITATSAAWLEIARRDGEVLVSKLLRSGETMVTVMDEALLLSTGNAGGLMVKTPTIESFQLGKVGEIIRDLPLSRDGMKVRYNLITY
jgi:cytoskeleton protein RodZ